MGQGAAAFAADVDRPGRSEVPMDRVWQALKEAVTRAVAGAGDAVTAMSLAVEGDVAVPVDRNGATLAPSILPGDTRADAVARDFQERVSPIEVMRVTGMPGGMGYPLLRLLWLKEHARDVYGDTYKFMGWQEYVAARLGLEPVTEATLAARTQMYDVINRSWASGIIDEAGLDRDKLSDVRETGTVLGEISRNAAAELGLPTGTKFVLGGHALAVSALGVGAASAGHAMDAVDGAEHLVCASHEPALDVQMMKNGFACWPHVVPDMYVSDAYNFTGANLLRWFARLVGADTAGAVDLDRLTAAMDDAPTDLLVLPYFTISGTPYLDPKPLGSVVGLTLETRRATLIRALLEGLAFEIRLNVVLLGESGVRVNDLHVAGPAATSRAWCQLKCDVLGMPLHRHPDVQADVLGAAMLAGVGTGVYDDASAAVAFCVSAEDSLYPNGERTDLYARKFLQYRRLYPALREIIP